MGSIHRRNCSHRRKMMKILFILVVLTCLALGEDFSAEDKTDLAVASGGDILHHSLAKRDAGKRRKENKKEAKRRGNGLQKIRKGGKVKGKRNGGAKSRGKGQGKRGKKGGKKERSKRRKIKVSGTGTGTGTGTGKGRETRTTECAENMKKFNSKIIRAGNIERQAKRITAFGDIKENKKGKKGNFNKTLETLI